MRQYEALGTSPSNCMSFLPVSLARLCLMAFDKGGILYEYVKSYRKWASGIAFRRYSSSLKGDRI